MSTTASPRHFHLIRLATGAAAVELFDGNKLLALPPFIRDDDGVPGEYDWGQVSADTVHLAYSMLWASYPVTDSVFDCGQAFTTWLLNLAWESNHVIHLDCVVTWIVNHLSRRLVEQTAASNCAGCGQ